MSQTPPPPVDVLPPTPSTNVPSTFAALADAFLASLANFRTQLVALAANCYANTVDAFNSANTATAQANAAIAAVGVTAWVSGTTYTAGQMRYSPINFLTYRRTTNGAGATDPSLDGANWTPPVQLGFQNEVLRQVAGTVTWTCPTGIVKIALDMQDGGYSSPTSSTSDTTGGPGGNAGFTLLSVTAGVVYTLTVGAGGVGGGAGTNTAAVAGGLSSFSGSGITTQTTLNASIKTKGGVSGNIQGGASAFAMQGSGVIDRAGGGGLGASTGAASNPGAPGLVRIRY